MVRIVFDDVADQNKLWSPPGEYAIRIENREVGKAYRHWGDSRWFLDEDAQEYFGLASGWTNCGTLDVLSDVLATRQEKKFAIKKVSKFEEFKDTRFLDVSGEM